MTRAGPYPRLRRSFGSSLDPQKRKFSGNGSGCLWIGIEVGEERQTKGILARARELNFLVAVLVAAVSAMSALALRAYQSFGLGEQVLLAAVVALIGIWGVPRILHGRNPADPL